MSKSTWQYRKADTLEERFGLKDSAKSQKYKRHPIFQEPEGPEKQGAKLTAMGLTSGVGSMLVGAQAAGFRVVGNLEWRDYYRYRTQGSGDSTFPKNFPGAYMARGLGDVPKDLLPTSIDFAAGHPECGRYSRLSQAVKGDLYHASRGSDVSDIPLFLQMVAELRPRFFLMDDLPDSFGPLPISEYVRLLPDYDLFPEWVSNWGYGNVQKHRNRMFVIGALKSERFVFRPSEEPALLVLADVLHDMTLWGYGDYPNHSGVDGSRTASRYVHMRYYGDRPSWSELHKILQDLGPSRNHPYFSPSGEAKRRPGTTNPKWEGPCPVLSGSYNPIHPTLYRPLTVRERARIQGFPDDFVFYYDEAGPFAPIWEPYSPDGQRGIKQTGKAMPLQFCTFVANQVKAHILKRPFKATGNRILRPNPKVTEAKVDFCTLQGYSDQEGACGACWHQAKCPLFAGVSPLREEDHASVE